MSETHKYAASLLETADQQEPAPWGQGKSKKARKRARRRAEVTSQDAEARQRKSAKAARKRARRQAALALQISQQDQIKRPPGEELRRENGVSVPATREDLVCAKNAVTLDFSANAGFQPFGPPAAAPIQERRPLRFDFGSGSTQSKWDSTIRGKGMPLFGQPEKQSTMFRHIPVTSEPLRERSIQDIYLENPEKRLRSIEPSTLYLVAQTIQQIADEAANDWHKATFPGMKWSDAIIADNSDDASSIGTVDINALNSRDYVIAPLLRASKAMVSKNRTISMLALCRIVDQCIAICRLVSDNRRQFLLQKAKEKIEWLPVGLDCKKLDIQRRAIRDIDALHENTRRKHVFTTNTEIIRSACVEAEINILDQSLVEFQEHRLEFLIDMFQTLKQLLGATA
jgi:hypothetical protein